VSIFFFLVALEKQKSSLLFLAGFSLGLAVLFKYPFGLLLAVMVPLIFWHKDSLLKLSSKTKAQELRRRLLGAGALVIGFSLPILIILVYFYTNAALKDFITTEFNLASNYVRLSFQDKSFLYFFTQGGFRFFACIALFLMTPLFLWFEKKLSAKTWFVIGWAGTCLLSVVLQGKFFRYHYFPLIAPLALLSLIVLYSYGEKKKRLIKKIRPALFGLGFLILCFLIGRLYLEKMFSLTSVVQGSITLRGHYYTCEEYDRGDFSLRADIEVADFLAKNTSSDEGIYIWGFEPIIYGLANRRCISRFIYNVPLYWKWVIPEYKEEFLDIVREKKPKYFMVVKNDALPWVTGLPYGSKRAFEDFVELKQIIVEEYELGIQIEDFMIYCLK